MGVSNGRPHSRRAAMDTVAHLEFGNTPRQKPGSPRGMNPEYRCAAGTALERALTDTTSAFDWTMSGSALRLILTACLAAPMLLRATELDVTLRPDLSDGRNLGRIVAVQPDGRILSDDGRVRYFPDGSRDPSYTPADTVIKATNVAAVGFTPAGKLLLWVDVPVFYNHQLLRLNADGSIDRILFVSNTRPLSLLQPDGRILLIGYNGAINGVPLTRLNADGSNDVTFHPPITNLADPAYDPFAFQIGWVWTGTVQPDGKIVVWADTRDAGVSHRGLIRLNADGTLDSSFAASLTGNITALYGLPDGHVLVGEWNPNRIVRLNADGSIDRVVGAVTGIVNGFSALSGGRTLAYGTFTQVGPYPRVNYVGLAPSGDVDLSFDASASARPITDNSAAPGAPVLQSDGKLFAYDNHSISAGVGYGGTPPPPRVVRLQLDGSVDATFALGTPSPASRLLLARDSAGRLLVAGNFVTASGLSRPGLARLHADGSADSDFAPQAGAIDSISSLTMLPDDAVVATGNFARPSTGELRHVMRFRPDGSVDTAFDVVLDGSGAVSSLAVLPDGRLVIVGDFASVNGVSRSHVAAIQADGKLDPNFGAQLAISQPVTRVVARSGAGGVFIAGSFSDINGQPRPGLAALTADGRLDATFVPHVGPIAISVLAADVGGGVVAGGSRIEEFKSYPGSTAPEIHRFAADGTDDTSFKFPIEQSVLFDALAEDSQGRLVVAYTSLLGAGYFPVERFLRDGRLDPTFRVGSGTNARVNSLLLESDDSLLLAGGFTRVDDLPANGIARLRLDRQTAPAALLFNLSTRGRTIGGDQILIGGFTIGGTVPKTVLLHAVGPTLAQYGIAGPLQKPLLQLFHNQTRLRANSGWQQTGDQYSPPLAGADIATFGQQSGAIALPPGNDAGVVVTLEPGSYTAQVTPAPDAQPGVTLLELFDVNAIPADRRLTNISSRGNVGTGEDQLIAGFVITGNAPRRVLIRAIGPTLGNYEVASPLADPLVRVVDSDQKTVGTNDDWGGDAALEVAFTATGAFGLPRGSKDAALILTLPPGAYTALVSGAGNSTGIALVEVYDYP
jgi:uncharacterized delta-60 repeat protein